MSEEDIYIRWSDFVNYNESLEGKLEWNVDIYSGHNNIRIHRGSPAGGVNSKGYWVTTIKGKRYYNHRILWEMTHNVKLSRSKFIDHIDGNTKNNAIENLRLTNVRGNSCNQYLSSSNKTGVVGVHRRDMTDKNGIVRSYFVASWNQNKVTHNRSFSIKKFGEEEAFKMACTYREEMIKELNNQGACYTERHGEQRKQALREILTKEK